MTDVTDWRTLAEAHQAFREDIADQLGISAEPDVDLVEALRVALGRANGKAADYCRLYQDASDQLERTESSRRDWAAEADRLTAALDAALKVMQDMSIWVPDHARRAARWDDAIEQTWLALNPDGHQDPVCACVTDDQADQLIAAGFSRPVCAVHPEDAP